MPPKKLLNKLILVAQSSWAAGVTAAGDISDWLAKTDWVRAIDENFSKTVSDAMDAGLKSGGAKSVAGLESFLEWGKGYFSNLSSGTGIPVAFAEAIYAFLKNLGVSEEVARDIITVNGQEAIESLLGGTIAAMALIFSWRDSDKERFSESLGAIGVSAMATLNPLTVVIAVVGLALGFQRQIIEAEAMKRGGLVNLVGLGVSAFIPGPILLGAIPAFVLAVYINKKLKNDVPVAEQIKALYEYVKSSEFRNLTSLFRGPSFS